jgi:hypothetical protein
MTLFFFLPYCVAWGLVAMQVFTLPARRAFWATVALCAAMPLGWMSVMYGYPDIGAAALIGLAVLLYVRDVELRSPWQRLLIGFVLFLAPLFRRHFAYGVTAFFAAVIVQHLILLAAVANTDRRIPLARAVRMAGRILSVGLVVAICLLLFARPFMSQLVGNNYWNLYRSYMYPPLSVLSGFNSAYGYLMSLSAVAGYVLGYRAGVFRSPAAPFVALMGIVSVLQWMFVVQQQGVHYTNHFNIFIIFGLLALAALAARSLRGAKLYLTSVLGGALLVYRLLVGFAVVTPVDSPNPAGVFMARNPPKVRRDLGEVKRLIGTLRETAPPGSYIFVGACSFTMNTDIIRNGEQDLFGRENVRLSLPQPPAIDSRDWLPVDMLLKSQFIVTVTPVQYSVDSGPERQKVVSLVVDAFQRRLPIARDFETLPGSYTFQNGGVATVHRRIRPTPLQTALRELSREEAMFAVRPGRQKAWVSVDPDQRCEVEGGEARGTWRVTLKEDGFRPTCLSPDRARRRALAFVGDVPPNATVDGIMRITGHWSSGPVKVRAAMTDADTGDVLGAGPEQILSDGKPLSLRLPDAPAARGGRTRPLLEITLPPEIDGTAGGKPRDGRVMIGRLTIH